MCLARWVTEPRLNRSSLATARWPPARIAVHLRTGFADVADRAVAAVPPSDAAGLAWLDAACPQPAEGGAASTRLGDGSPRFVTSDSPGLTRALRARHAAVRSSVPPAALGARAVGATRSWMTSTESKYAAHTHLPPYGN